MTVRRGMALSWWRAGLDRLKEEILYCEFLEERTLDNRDFLGEKVFKLYSKVFKL